MSRQQNKLGAICWADLTVEDAAALLDFYAQVVGWSHQPVGMGGYEDYAMAPGAAGEPVAGVCHSRGPNANLPPVWLIYVVVECVERSVERCLALGGSVIDGPRPMGGKRFCVIRDPAGAAIALIEP